MPRLEDPYEHPHSHRTATVPKTTPSYTSITPSEKSPDEAINPPALRWFRRDDLVRKCEVINAAFATFAAGFDTVLDPIDENISEQEKEQLQKEYADVKAFVDGINRRVNLDNILFIAQIKRSLFGKCGFEIVTDGGNAPARLISLVSDWLKPQVNKEWMLTGYKYESTPEILYKPEEILYFVNLQLESDYEGVSDVEPIFSQCDERHQLIKTDFKKVVKRLWAPYSVHQVNGEGLTDQEETEIMNNIAQKTEAGEILVTNTPITSTIVDIRPNIADLIALKQNLEQDIISNFGTPRFLLNRPTENRATAYTEFEAYIEGPIKTIQRYFKRELEAQWYPALVKLALKLRKETRVPVKISHHWRKIRTADIYQMAVAANQLYNNGLGILGDHPEVAVEMVGIDPKILQDNSAPKREAPKTEEQKKEEKVEQ